MEGYTTTLTPWGQDKSLILGVEVWQGGVKWGLVAGPSRHKSGPLALQSSTEQATSCLGPGGCCTIFYPSPFCLRMAWGGLLVYKAAGAH